MVTTLPVQRQSVHLRVGVLASVQQLACSKRRAAMDEQLLMSRY